MSQLCTALRHGKNPCQNEMKELYLGTIPLCVSHLTPVKARLKEERDKGYRKCFSEFIDRRVEEQRQKVARPNSVVYFIKAGRRIKIGYSQSPEKRLAQIRGGHGCIIPMNLNTANAKIIATEDGGPERERELHKQFKHLQNAGEWFWAAPDLNDYIKSISDIAA